MTVIPLRPRPVDEPVDDIHGYFGLTYSGYKVVPRALAQSMPSDWQERAVRVFRELDEAYRDLEAPTTYLVKPGIETEYGDLDEYDLRTNGITQIASDDLDDPYRYVDRQGIEHEHWERIVVEDLNPDPVGDYNRGRRYIAPREAS